MRRKILKVNSAPSTLKEGIVINGDIQAREDIHINCLVNGMVTSSAKVVIGSRGEVVGDLNVTTLVVDGTIKGNVTADSIMINGTAIVEVNSFLANSIAVGVGASLEINSIVASRGNKSLSDTNLILLDTTE